MLTHVINLTDLIQNNMLTSCVINHVNTDLIQNNMLTSRDKPHRSYTK